MRRRVGCVLGAKWTRVWMIWMNQLFTLSDWQLFRPLLWSWIPQEWILPTPVPSLLYPMWRTRPCVPPHYLHRLLRGQSDQRRIRKSSEYWWSKSDPCKRRANMKSKVNAQHLIHIPQINRHTSNQDLHPSTCQLLFVLLLTFAVLPSWTNEYRALVCAVLLSSYCFQFLNWSCDP
jgi:hypothetical protein